MKNVGFELIHEYGQVVAETKHYSFYQLEEVKNRYDSNFIKLHEMPSSGEFQQLVSELSSLAVIYGNTHGKFVFPEGVKPSTELVAVAKELGFDWSFLELYKIKPQDFVGGHGRSSLDVQVGWISPELVNAYELMHYDEKVQWGEAYATAIRTFKNGLIARGEINIAVALLNGEIVGSADVICDEQFLEIDDFLVKPNYQKHGIGTAIQQFLMQEAGERTVILVADGEDTPKEMYKRQGYQFVTFQYAALCQEFVK